MIKNDTFKGKTTRLALTQEEWAILDDYLSTNAIKLAPLLRLLILKELKNKEILKSPEFLPPISCCLKKGVRKIVQDN